MDAKPRTLAGNRRQVLSTLVERYESHAPVEPPNPVDALLYYRESCGLARLSRNHTSVAELAWPES